MRDRKRMTVSEMDLVNTLISLTAVIDRLRLSERERALAYFRYKEREVDANLSLYANRFDALVRDANTPSALNRLKDCALQVRNTQ